MGLDAGITYTDARFDKPVEILPGIEEDRFIESPEWSGVVKVNYTHDETLDAFIGLIYTGPMIALREAEGTVNADTGHFLVVDLSFTRHFEFADGSSHLDVTLGVRNLLDHRQKDLTSGPERDTTYFYGPRFPRSFFLKLAWNF